MKNKDIHWLRLFWYKVLVFLGIRVWAKKVYSRPKHRHCAYHGCLMKRTRKSKTGAYYWCPKCRKHYHLYGGGSKLVRV